MQTSQRTSSFLQHARDKAAAIHQMIERGAADGEASMRTTLAQAGASAAEFAESIRTHAKTADASIRAKLSAAAAHADAVAHHAGEPRRMLDEAQKLSRSITEAVANVRTSGGSGAQR